MLELSTNIGLFNATVLMILLKFGILEDYAARFGHIPWLPPGDCFFCLGFWFAVLESIGFFIISPDPKWLVIPFISTAVSTFVSHAIIKD